MNDEQLYRLAKRYGANALEWRRKFIGLLPEVNRRRLYMKKGFPSIFVFAAKLCGLSREQVQRALKLEQRFADKPALKKALVDGEVSMHKLARVASIATAKNEAQLARACMTLPQSSLETMVRDYKNENGLNKPLNEGYSVRAHRIELSDEVQNRLQKLAEKGHDVNGVLLELLDQREAEIAEEKEAIAESLQETRSRYIPVRVRRIIKKEHGSRCSMPQCCREADHLHHTQTFALSRRHDPRYLAPLCKDHHRLAHAINLKVQAHTNNAVLRHAQRE